MNGGMNGGMNGAALRASLAAFDEPALVTLANVGLYRRAARDVAENKALMVGLSKDGATIEVDGQRVTIDARGPKAGSCTCKASGICRHSIAAVLLVQTSGTFGDAKSPEERAAPLDPLELLAAFQLAKVERWAGKAGWRAALEIANGPAVVTAEDTALTIAFADSHPVVRLLRGRGFEGIVSKAPAARQNALHAAAIITARRYFGLAEPDTIPSQPIIAEQALPDPAFLSRVEAAIADCAMFAFNLAPELIEEQLFTLSVSSRADALPRLGRLLRALAAQMQLKRQRAFTFDPDLCFETLATAYALVQALGAATSDTDPARLGDLCGAHRQSFAPADSLRLVGCGVDQWRTEAGARGVTGIFYDSLEDRWLTYAHARGPGQDPLFDRQQAYMHSAIWNGVTLAQLGGETFVLEGAGVSDGGRLSNPSGAMARIDAMAVLQRDEWRCRVNSWSKLAHRLANRFGFGLSRRIDADFVILVPQRFAPPYFDDLAQDLVWPVEDRDGQWLALNLSHGEDVAAMIERIETLGRQGWEGEVLVRATQTVDRITLAPIAIFEAGKPRNLALDTFRSDARNDRARSRFRLRLGSSVQGDQLRFGPVETDRTMMELQNVWQRMIDLAEAGLERARPTSLDALSRSAGLLDGFGCAEIAGRLTALAKQPQAHFLGTAYANLTARRQRARLQMLRPRRPSPAGR